jgi:heme oxygenase
LHDPTEPYRMNHPPFSSAGPALQALRAATASRHAAIEGVLQLSPSADLQRFAAALQVFEAFLREWEPLAARALPAAMRPWFAAHRRGHLATQDVQRLGLAPVDLGALAVLPLPSPAAALGSVYVIEGSALGGTLIAKAMSERFSIGTANGAAFFGARGSATARIWREFCAQLEVELAGDAVALEQACDAACATFDRLAHALRKQLPDQAAGSVK